MSPFLKTSLMIVYGMAVFFTASPSSAADKVILGDNVIVATPAVQDNQKTLADTINFMAKDLSCTEDKDCHSIGFGDKPCGGFQTYKIYSAKTLNTSDFTDLVRKYNDQDKKDNQENGMASTCEMVIEPSVACVQGQCTSVGIGPNAQ